MRNEIPENAVISETPKPNRSAALAIAIIAFIFSLYASIISTHNFYYVFFQKNARPEKADVASAVAMQNQRQLQSLQTAITALEKNQPQTEKTSGIAQSLFADIAAINMQIQMLSVLPKAPTVITKTEGTSSSWHAWMIDGLKQIKSLFLIRHVDVNSPPFVSSDDELLLKKNISLQLSMAQWAILHHDNVVYQTTLKTVSNWLTTYFSLASETNTIAAKIKVLQAQSVSGASTATPQNATLPAIQPENQP